MPFKPDDLVWVPLADNAWAAGWVVDMPCDERVLVATVCQLSARIIPAKLRPSTHVFQRSPKRRGRDRPTAHPPWVRRRCVTCKSAKRWAEPYTLECAQCAQNGRKR